MLGFYFNGLVRVNKHQYIRYTRRFQTVRNIYWWVHRYENENSNNDYFQPGSSIEIKVELLGTQEGCFNKEFWIKTDPLQRVRLLGTFITPKLEIRHPPQTYSLTLVQFPKTYYGAQSSKILVIQNLSSRPTMFCTVAEFQGKTLVSIDTFTIFLK